MKRMIFVGAAILAAGSAFAAGSGTIAAGSSQAVTDAAASCDFLSAGASVTLNTSKNTVGAWDCTSNYIGVGTGSTAGQKKTFKGSSAGGKIAEGTACAAAACTTGEAATAALAGSNGT